MAKRDMARSSWNKQRLKNDISPVPQIQGKARTGKKKVEPIIAGTMGSELKARHEKPIPKVYRELDTDLARDNIENNMTFADLQDLQ